METLTAGKRYYFFLSDDGRDGRVKSGLFTGEYKSNGNAVLVAKNGERWSIPPENLMREVWK